MNCKDTRENLINYIDGELSYKEEKLIKDHLENCSDCKSEYEELKSTIDYVIDKSKLIDTSEDIKLDTTIKRKKLVKRFTRTGLIAIALSVILVVSAVATDMFGFMEHWKKHSAITENAWEELLDKGVGQKLDVSTTDKAIKITAEGVISDELNTIILLTIEDLKGNERYTPFQNSSRSIEDSKAIVLGGDVSNEEFTGDNIPMMYDFEPIYSILYSENENISKLMVWTNPLDKDVGNIDISIKNLQVAAIPYGEGDNKTYGNWNLTIPVEVVASKKYEINRTMDMGGQDLEIKNIVVAPTSTAIQYQLDPYNIENDYYIDNISFLIESNKTIYGRSELGLNNTFLYPEDLSRKGGYTKAGEYKIKSLYLQDPKEINLILSSFNASLRGNQSYGIDYNNLPQTLDYKNNKITIEDIEMEEDKTRIIIREDDSKDRKYINSDIRVIVRQDTNTIENGIRESFSMGTVFSASILEYESRDEKGKITEEDWSDNYYNYVFKQELIIDKEDFEWRKIDEDNNKELFLRPQSIDIAGLYYKEFPNTKITIELK